MLNAPVTIAVMSTSYCEHGTTASGEETGPSTIAVDPAVIPLRSRVRLFVHDAKDWLGHAMHLKFKRAIYRASDTGSAIQGKRIDLWMSSCSDALAWGRRMVQVEVTPATTTTTQVITVKHLRRPQTPNAIAFARARSRFNP